MLYVKGHLKILFVTYMDTGVISYKNERLYVQLPKQRLDNLFYKIQTLRPEATGGIIKLNRKLIKHQNSHHSRQLDYFKSNGARQILFQTISTCKLRKRNANLNSSPHSQCTQSINTFICISYCRTVCAPLNIPHIYVIHFNDNLVLLKRQVNTPSKYDD